MSLDFARRLAVTMMRTTATCAAKPASLNRPRSSAELQLYIGIDSGPAHLANAVKTPGVILLGRYWTWDYYMPYTGFYADARNCRILRHAGPVTDLPLDLCLNTVDEVLPALLDTSDDPQHA